MLDSPNEDLRARGDDDPKLCLRPVSRPPFDTALWSKGLEAGEKGVPEETRRSEKLALADSGEELGMLTGLAFRDVDNRYLGGVT